MSRPKQYQDERVSTALRLPVELHERLKAAAEERDVSANWLINRAIAAYLDQLVPAGDLMLTRSTA